MTPGKIDRPVARIEQSIQRYLEGCTPATSAAWTRRGAIWRMGRLAGKDLIKTGGENVYPAEVESVLRRHPAVAEAVVIGVPDARWGEAMKAICVPVQPGAPFRAT